MKNKKVLFFDVDGTLLTPKKRIVEPATIEILKELSSNPDIDLYLSSGRGRETLNDVEHIIPFFTGLNLANGGHIIINDKEYLSCIDKDVVKKIVKFMIINNLNSKMNHILSSNLKILSFILKQQNISIKS